uniref:J domain-containing protein n=1 Tax=Neobodo designis TaxID=312471 RepID=A0A7S1Q9M7_NEODS|mmetsp:Transcript_3593/g.11242  ORF Transcript_3593/g.11242 Transcript_3593/m.11242 type:complete len:490 (+) Transcript_3593:104-1573(+)|eukprot:CAMPEP_0174827790 /NCGR_PEP_ID=MMETSP1114-20130205/932_1 /TAXON_ID=312471 /ORGANISM="Neobodo designis, Strain CCAP 1951/1" /LENGTH=489 /DNA_ID=CAMNT_0016061467 /DNA_START=105 /DNA_END=1574 /DNA_ORIENTATION=-
MADDERQDANNADAAAAAENAMSKVTIFSTRRPQHFAAGVSSGLKNFARGVAGGAASLVAMPVVGYKQEGAKGAAKGFGLGVLSCAAMSLAGATTGAVQIVRGAYNTPEAVREQAACEKLWHPNRREWVTVRLAAMLQEQPADDSDIIKTARARKVRLGPDADDDGTSDDANRAHDAAVEADRSSLPSYYDVLEVPKAATASEIKKAYAKAALKHHPDKNVGDASAAERFKAVGEAYRVLSNDITRAEYDRTGKRADAADASQQQTSHMPGLVTHPMQELLGGDAFLPYIGHLYLAVAYFNDLYSFTEAEYNEWQERRCVRAAGHLAGLFDRMQNLKSSDGPDAVKELLVRRTTELLNAGHGRELSKLLAERLALVADKYRSMADGNVLKRGASSLEELRQSAVGATETAAAAYKTVRTMVQHKQLTSDDVVPMLLRLASSDIAATVDLAAMYVVYDHSVSKDERWTRAENMAAFADFLYNRCAPQRIE